MRRSTRRSTLVVVLPLALVAGACGVVNRGAGDAPGARSGVETIRRMPVTLVLGRTSVTVTDETLPFTLRLANTARDSVRVDFTGDPLFPRGPRDKVRVPALWFTIEREDRASSMGSVARDFAPRDTVLAPGEAMEVPVQHSLREVGMSPGTYRMRAGIGAHASNWVTFTVTR